MKDQEQPDSGTTDVPKLIAEEDVDILPYMDWAKEDQICLEDEVWDEVCVFIDRLYWR